MPITDYVTANDGSLVGLSITFLAASVVSWVSYFSSSSTLRRIRRAPSARVSDLRSLLDRSDHAHGQGVLVAVRGQVQANLASASGWLGVKNKGALLHRRSNQLAVIVQQTQKCVYKGTWGFCRNKVDPEEVFTKSKDERSLSLLRSVPFILVEGGRHPHSAYVHVSLEKSTHPLPLTIVYQHKHSPWYSPLWTMMGQRCPVELVDEEKIFPIGKETTAIGICRIHDGALEIKSCTQLPYFLSDMTKEEIEAKFTMKTKILLWSGVVLGLVSISILGYTIIRNWRRWKELGIGSQDQGSSTENLEDVPERELCVICLARRRVYAFLPCGHRICCQTCAIYVESHSQRCLVCQKRIRSYMRTYNS